MICIFHEEMHMLHTGILCYFATYAILNLNSEKMNKSQFSRNDYFITQVWKPYLFKFRVCFCFYTVWMYCMLFYCVLNGCRWRQAASDKAEAAAGDGGGSGSRAVSISGLLLHNAVLNDGSRLVVAVADQVGVVLMLQLSDSTKRPPTSATNEHLLYRCPVRMRDGNVIGEIGLPCEDSAVCQQNDVYLSYSELQ